MRLRVDATPTLVSRTAIGRIVSDSARDLAHLGCRFTYLNKSFAQYDIENRKRESIARRVASILRHAEFFAAYLGLKSLFQPYRKKIRRRSPLSLYFDPLYVIFSSYLEHSIVFVLDLTPITQPQWHDRRIRLLYEFAYRKLAASRCRLVCISKSTAMDLRVNFGIDPKRISILPLYTPTFKLLRETGSQDAREVGSNRYFLFVGSLEARKNIIGLINAFEKSALAESGYELVIIGGKGKGHEKIIARAEEVRGVHLLGYVTDDELDDYYKNAAAFVYPSFWEGFGVPLLEAMARGVPCISTNSGASPEVGGESVLYVDPCDQQSIAAGMRKIITLSAADRQRMIDQGKARAAEFSYDHYITGLKSIIECAEREWSN